MMTLKALATGAAAGTRTLLGAAALVAVVAYPTVAAADPTLRVQVNQRGDFLLIGNTLGYDCAVGLPSPIVVGTLDADACQQSASDLKDSSPDVFWVADQPVPGDALADTDTLPASARSTAVLSIPAGATVTQAFLYWAATNTTGVADSSVVVDRPGVAGFAPVTLTALQSWVPGVDNAYQSVADVTTLVQTNGSGAFRVSGIDVAPFANVDKDVLFGGWWLVVFYADATDPLRNLALFDGLDVVRSGHDESATLSGFLVPTSGFTGKLGVVAFEGDATAVGDSLLFNNTALSNAQNPVNNFFNSTRSTLGSAVSVSGDLPQLTGTAGSLAGVDLDIVDITAQLTQGQTSAPLEAKTTGDTYYLAGFVTSLSTFAPDLTTSTKTAVDVNGGLLIPGDVVKYTIAVTNDGNDASAKTVVSDPLPTQVTYVPGSITIGGVSQTDAPSDDEAEYTAASRSVVARLGTGANATTGGQIAAGGTVVVTFEVTVNAGVTGEVDNQGSISAGGVLGAPVATTPTDGNGPLPGAPPTAVFVDACATNADCAAPDPVCDLAVSPHACVPCLIDSDCGGLTSGLVCNPSDQCIPGCRGIGGNGCPTTEDCSSTTTAIGTCSVIDAGAGDTGVHDGGDTGPGDTGPGDTGPGDTGPGDTGPRDTGPGDTGPGDTGPGDTGLHEASVDTGAGDTGTHEAGPVDTGVHEAATADTGAHDAGHDAPFPVFDAGVDAGGLYASGGGCNCTTAGSREQAPWSAILGFSAAALFVKRRRRRG